LSYVGRNDSDFLVNLDSLIGPIARGISPSFNEAHVLKAFELIDRHGVVGRIILSRELQLGIGSTRTLIRRLNKNGITEKSKNGLCLSSKGKALFSDMRNKLTATQVVSPSYLTGGHSSVGLIVKNKANLIISGTEQRDSAIRNGALGATTLVFSNNKFSFPSGTKDFIQIKSNMQKKLTGLFEPKENDVLILVFGENTMIADLAAKMVAIDLLKKKII
jgi:hypothetical protein